MNNMLFVILLGIPGAILAVSVHEYTRALTSHMFGDQLPKQKKRLTINPFRHVEPIGLILMLVSGGFGWGQPVETSGLYYKNRKQMTLIVAVLPSIVNLFLGFILVFLYKISPGNAWVDLFLSNAIRYTVALAVYNLVPIYPMDCLKVLSVVLPANQYFQFMQYEKTMQMIFLLLLFMGVFTGLFDGIIYFFIQLFHWLLFFV